VLRELEAHPSLGCVASSATAEQIAGLALASGRPIEWHLAAVVRTADKAAGAALAGEPWPQGAIGSYLLRACRSPARPRDDDDDGQVADPIRPLSAAERALFAVREVDPEEVAAGVEAALAAIRGAVRGVAR